MFDRGRRYRQVFIRPGTCTQARAEHRIVLALRINLSDQNVEQILERLETLRTPERLTTFNNNPPIDRRRLVSPKNAVAVIRQHCPVKIGHAKCRERVWKDV